MRLSVALFLLLFPAILTIGQDTLYLTSPTMVTDYLGGLDDYDVEALTENKFIVAYYDGGSSEGFFRVGTLNDTNISFGYAFPYASGQGLHNVKLGRLSDTRFILTYRSSTVTRIIVYELVNGSQINMLDYFDLAYGYFQIFSLAALSEDKFIIAYIDQVNDHGRCSLFKINESTGVSLDSTYDFTSSSLYSISLATCALSESRFVITWGDSQGWARVGALDGNDVVTFGTAFKFNSSETNDIDIKELDAERFILVFSDDYTYWKGTALIGTVDASNNITCSNKFPYNQDKSYENTVTSLNASEVVIGFIYGSGSYSAYLLKAEINGNSLSFSNFIMISPYASNNSPNPLSSLSEHGFIVFYLDEAEFGGYVRLGSTIDFAFLSQEEILEDNGLAIYPNPTHDQITIKKDSGYKDGEIKLFDITGRLVALIPTTTEITSFNLTGKPDGIYFLQILTDRGLVMKKIVKNSR